MWWVNARIGIPARDRSSSQVVSRMRLGRGTIRNGGSPCDRWWQPILRAFEELPWHARRMPDTATARLLLVEDDHALSTLLAELFVEEGYQVRVAYDAQRGLHLGLTEDYDALIVDRGLPVMDGLDVVSALRSRGVDTPILLLTARGALADRVAGLDAGAQDYLLKPFEVPELLARVRALVRRPNASSTLRVGGWSLDRVTRTVSGPAGGADVELSEREAALLGVLMTTPGRIHTRDQLLRLAFDGVDNPGVVDTYVHYLRRKLGRGIVATVHGTGYRLGG